MTDRQSTHGPDCWGWGPKHYECAVNRIERLAEALALLPDEIVMIEHNPDEGPLMFCCGRKVTLSWRHDLIPTHDEGCWYARMRALRDRDQEAAMREEGKA